MSGRKIPTGELSTDAQEVIKQFRLKQEGLLGVKSESLTTASEVCKALTSNELISMLKAINKELSLRAGEVPTQQEMWMVEQGDKIGAALSVRNRLGCDLPMALKILSLV